MNTLETAAERPVVTAPRSTPAPTPAQVLRSLHVDSSALLILLSAAVMVLPLILRGPACGADFIFHYTSWHNALSAWQHGTMYPHWAASANFNAGEPRFVFYPPLVWMLGAALGALLPWHAVPAALSFILLAGAGLATRALARLFVPAGASTLAACTAIFSGYAFYELYYHGDFALASGGLWIPLLLFLFFRRGRAERATFSTGALDRETALLALALAGAWLSNTPLGLMATYLLATVAIISAIQTRSAAPLGRAALAIAIALGLAAFCIVPASLEQHWIDVQKLFAASQHLVQNRWITSDLRSAHERKRGLIAGVMLLMSFFGLAVTWWRGRGPSTLQARRWWTGLAIIPFAVLFLMLPVSLPVWNIVPRLRYLQYPLRWLVVLQPVMAIFFAAAIWSVRARLRPYALAACAVAFLAAVFGTSHSKSFFRPGSAARTGPYSLRAMDDALASDGSGVGGADEYATPVGARNELIAAQAPDACLTTDATSPLSSVAARNPVAFYTPQAWSPALGSCDQTFGATATSEHFALNATTDHAGYLVLRLRSYPAWKVVVNGQRLRAQPRRDDGLLAVEVPQGPVHLTVDWTTTQDVLLGRALTTIAAAILAGLWFFTRRRAVA